MRTLAVSGLSGTAIPPESWRLFPTARQTERDGQLTPLRDPLDPISWSECPVERSADAASRDAAPPEFAFDATLPTPMHLLAEAQATPLKMVIGEDSLEMALADVVKKGADPAAKPTKVSVSIKDPRRTGRFLTSVTSSERAFSDLRSSIWPISQSHFIIVAPPNPTPAFRSAIFARPEMVSFSEQALASKCRRVAPRPGVRGHPWAMCCSLIGETFCPG